MSKNQATEATPVPQRMQSLPRFRGLPIPFAFFVAEDGKPDFKTIDQAKWADCARFQLCGLCGSKLGRHVYFIGGPISASHGHYADPPMHEDCARYALKVCPFLAMGKSYSTAPVGEGARKLEHVSEEVPEKFGLLHSLGFEVVPNGPQDYVFKASEIVAVEWHFPTHR